jgi:hypothetical protein
MFYIVMHCRCSAASPHALERIAVICSPAHSVVLCETCLRAFGVLLRGHECDSVNVLLLTLVDARRCIEEQATAICASDFVGAEVRSRCLALKSHSENRDEVVSSVGEGRNEVVHEYRYT